MSGPAWTLHATAEESTHVNEESSKTYAALKARVPPSSIVLGVAKTVSAVGSKSWNMRPLTRISGMTRPAHRKSPVSCPTRRVNCAVSRNSGSASTTCP